MRASFLEPDGSEIEFRGTWGLDNNISAFWLGPSKSEAPDSPTAHPEWKHPGAAILCSRKWFAPEDAKPSKRSCALLKRAQLEAQRS